MKIVISVEEAKEIILAELKRRGLPVEDVEPKIHRDYDECEFQGFEAKLPEVPAKA